MCPSLHCQMGVKGMSRTSNKQIPHSNDSSSLELMAEGNI